MRNRRVLLLGLVALLTVPALAGQETEKKKGIVEHYTGVVVSTGGRTGGRTMRIDVRIKDYTTDDEIREYLTLLQEGGQDKVRDFLDDKNLGDVSPSFSTGTDLAIVRSSDKDGGKVVRLWTARPMGFVELYYGGRSRDYPFALIELRVDAEGKGEGSIIAGAKISIKDNQIEIESFGNQYLKLTNVIRYNQN